jgi:hypothetical protein
MVAVVVPAAFGQHTGDDVALSTQAVRMGRLIRAKSPNIKFDIWRLGPYTIALLYQFQIKAPSSLAARLKEKPGQIYF